MTYWPKFPMTLFIYYKFIKGLRVQLKFIKQVNFERKKIVPTKEKLKITSDKSENNSIGAIRKNLIGKWS